jgi:hypothetical protein
VKRWVSIRRNAAGHTVVTVSLVDGELSSKAEVKTYSGQIEKATKQADKDARTNLEAVKNALEGS